MGLGAWFWLLLLSIIGFVIFFVLYETNATVRAGGSAPLWIWLVFIISLIVFLLALVLYIFSGMRCKFVFVCKDDVCSKPEPPCAAKPVVQQHPLVVVQPQPIEPPCPTVRHIPNILTDDPCDTSANKYGAFGAAVQVGPVYNRI